MAKGNLGKLLLTGVVGGAIALGGSAIYQTTTNQNGTSSSNTTSTKVSNVSVNVSTDVTAAIKKVSGSVVSVMNYQKQNSSDDFSSIFGNFAKRKGENI